MRVGFAANTEHRQRRLAPRGRLLLPINLEREARTDRRQSFPEVDRAEWFDIEFARTKMLSAQVELLDRLLAIVAESDRK